MGCAAEVLSAEKAAFYIIVAGIALAGIIIWYIDRPRKKPRKFDD